MCLIRYWPDTYFKWLTLSVWDAERVELARWLVGENILTNWLLLVLFLFLFLHLYQFKVVVIVVAVVIVIVIGVGVVIILMNCLLGRRWEFS